MKTMIKNKRMLSLMSILVLGAMVATPLVSPASTSAATAESLPGITGPEFDLHAVEGRILTPEGNSIYMWGFGAEDPDNPGSYKFQYPSPNLIVGEGDNVVINLTNDLAVPVSITFPGQVDVMYQTPAMIAPEPVQPELNPDDTLASLTTSVAPGGTITYSFIADEPGTYLYESGANPALQVQMGLFGMLIVRPALGDSYAYNDPATEFNPSTEYPLLFHELDPVIHEAVEDGEAPDLAAYWPRYWTINGRCFPDTLAGDNVPWLPGQPYGSMVVIEPNDPDNLQPALIRFANAGVHAHPFHTHGNHVRVIGHDGRQSLGPLEEDLSQEHFTLTVGPGQTYDATFVWTDVNQWDPETNPIPHLPDMRNLAFTGTWYSGSPYLGEKGDMGVWTVSFNQLGEYYFPWHTHSEREMTNWGGEMGGMMTFLRVNPPGTGVTP